MMADPDGKATCVKADTLWLPSNDILNYAVFDVVMELVYLLIKPNISDHLHLTGKLIWGIVLSAAFDTVLISRLSTRCVASKARHWHGLIHTFWIGLNVLA